MGSPIATTTCPDLSLNFLHVQHAPMCTGIQAVVLQLLLGNRRAVSTSGLLLSLIPMSRTLSRYPPSSLTSFKSAQCHLLSNTFLIILLKFSMTMSAFSVHFTYFIFLHSSDHNLAFYTLNSFCLPWPACFQKAGFLLFCSLIYSQFLRTVPMAQYMFNIYFWKK